MPWSLHPSSVSNENICGGLNKRWTRLVFCFSLLVSFVVDGGGVIESATNGVLLLLLFLSSNTSRLSPSSELTANMFADAFNCSTVLFFDASSIKSPPRSSRPFLIELIWKWNSKKVLNFLYLWITNYLSDLFHLNGVDALRLSTQLVQIGARLWAQATTYAHKRRALLVHARSMRLTALG